MISKDEKGVVYVLWAFLGLFGFHRFYFGKYKSGLILCAMTFIGFPLYMVFPEQPNFGFALLWWFFDLFYITYLIYEKKELPRGAH